VTLLGPLIAAFFAGSPVLALLACVSASQLWIGVSLLRGGRA
jgi:hypothetical protein